MINIAFLIPVKIEILTKDSNIFKLINNFKINYNKKYNYNFYLGFDFNSKVLENKNILTELNNENIKVHIIEFSKDISFGYLTKMWNELFKLSLEDNDYFYQLGDDIDFETYDIFDYYIENLKKNNNLGVTGFKTINGNTKILTQSFVSKIHYDIFGFYFPESIINWFCDDWISNVYEKQNLYIPLEKKIKNLKITNKKGGRYAIKNTKNEFKEELKKGEKILKLYLEKSENKT